MGCPTNMQGQGEHVREALKEEEQLLIITRLHQVRLEVPCRLYPS